MCVYLAGRPRRYIIGQNVHLPRRAWGAVVLYETSCDTMKIKHIPFAIFACKASSEYLAGIGGSRPCRCAWTHSFKTFWPKSGTPQPHAEYWDVSTTKDCYLQSKKGIFSCFSQVFSVSVRLPRPLRMRLHVREGFSLVVSFLRFEHVLVRSLFTIINHG